MRYSIPLIILFCLVIVGLSACSSEKQEINILEKKTREQIEAVNRLFKEHPDEKQFTLTIVAPVKVSLNLKENSAITTTEVKMAAMRSPDRKEIESVRMSWRRYQNSGWEMEYVSPRELNETLLMIKQIEQFKKTRQ